MYNTLIKLAISAILGTIADKLMEYFEMKRTVKAALNDHEKERAEKIYEKKKRMDEVVDGDQHTVGERLRRGDY